MSGHLRNWIGDQNRFGLASPPTWWLQRLADFDNQLVIIPSRQEPVYRIARRRQFSPGIGTLALLDTQRDTAMLASYGLVPVTTMIRYAQRWEIDSLLQKLRDRDTWALSGGPMSGRSAAERAERVVGAIEQQEDALAAKERQRMRDDLDYRGKDAWKSYQARTGQRTRLADQPTRKSPAPGSIGAVTGERRSASGRIILATA